MARLMMVLDRDEIQQNLPYQLICETREGAHWNTMRRKVQYKTIFTDGEREAATRIFRLAHKWTLTTGVPDEVTMAVGTYKLWQKLGAFCLSI